MCQVLKSICAASIDAYMCVCRQHTTIPGNSSSSSSSTASLIPLGLCVPSQCAIFHFKIDAYRYDIFKIFSHPSNVLLFGLLIVASIAHHILYIQSYSNGTPPPPPFASLCQILMLLLLLIFPFRTRT